MEFFPIDRDLISRNVLSAPSAHHQIRTLNKVILVVSILSTIGAGWIILSFCLFKQVRTFRHQLILGLAISDFWMAVNFMSSCAVNLSGHIISEPPQKAFCSFNGFMTQLFVVQTDYWVLSIALCTYFILANHKHLSTWVQEHRIILWSLPWVFSALWAALGLGIAGYGDIGAWCWFTSDKVRLLVNFLPRWIIIIIIIGLYAHLYRIIFQAHNRFISFNDTESPHTHTHTIDPENGTVSSTRRIGHPSASMHLASKDVDVERSGGAIQGRSHVRQPSRMLKKMAYQMMSYPIMYMLIWTIPTSIRIYQSVTGKSAPFGIATVDKACIVIQGLADAIIYGVNETSLAVWRDRFRKSPPTALASGTVGSIHVSVQREVKVERTKISIRSDADSL